MITTQGRKREIKLDLMKEKILNIADKENLTIAEVLTILRFSQILDNDNNLRQKYFGSSLNDIWNNIPDKTYWLKIYKEQNKKRKRKRRR